MRSPDFGRRFGFSKNFPDRHALIGGHRRSTLDRRGTDAARRLIDDAKQTRVVSIGKHAQVGNHILDFLTIKKAQSTVYAVRNAVGRKHTFEIARQIVIAIEDRKITVLFAATLFDKDILHDGTGFLHICVGSIQPNRFARSRIGPEIFAHAVLVVRDNSVGPIENVRGRTVVLLKFDDFLDFVLFDKVGHIAYFGSSEGINRLIVIAHTEHTCVGLLGRAQGLDQTKLKRVRILKFIHKHILEAIVVVFTHQLIAFEKFDATQHQLGKIHEPLALAARLVCLIKRNACLVLFTSRHSCRTQTLLFVAVD